MLNASKVPQQQNNSKFPRPEPLEAGAYPARLVQIVGLGVQKQDPYQGQEKPPVNMLRVTYELSDEFMLDEDGNEDKTKPRWVSEDFAFHNINSDLATSTKRYYALDPTFEHGGDWTQLLGKACVVNLTLKEGKGKNAGRWFNNVGSVATMRTKEAEKAPELVNDPKVFDPSEPDIEMFLSFPEFIQEKIKSALDYGDPLKSLVEGHKPAQAGVAKEEAPKAPEKAPMASEDASDDEDW